MAGLRALHCQDLQAIQHVDNLLIIKFFIHSLYTPSVLLLFIYLHSSLADFTKCKMWDISCNVEGNGMAMFIVRHWSMFICYTKTDILDVKTKYGLNTQQHQGKANTPDPGLVFVSITITQERGSFAIHLS